MLMTIRTQAKTSPVPKRPTPPQVRTALNLLFVTAVIALISTLGFFAPENIFKATQSRLQTPQEVLWSRVSAIRPNNTLTETDEALRTRMHSLDGRLLYLTYGPSVTAECPFCNSDDPLSFLWYAIPSILVPHLLNFVVLGLASSTSVAGKEGRRIRLVAVTLGILAAIIEIYAFGSYDFKLNARAIYTEDYVHFYWAMRTLRGIGIAVMDIFLAGLLWAMSTNRIFVNLPNPAERIESVARMLESARGKLGAVGIVRNVVLRDETCRKTADDYWRREGAVMRDIMDEREVVDGVRTALESGRISVVSLEEEAKKYADGIVVPTGPVPMAL